MADFTPDELIQKKKEFAKRLIKCPTDPFKAATYIFPDTKDMGNRLIVAHDWPKDSVVIFEMDRLIDNNETEIVLPKNYVVTQLPEKISVKEKFGEYNASVIAENNKLIYKRKLTIYDGVYPKEEYESYRKFLEQVNKFDNIKVILDSK